MDQTQSIAALALTNLPLNGVAWPLVIDELLLLCCHKLCIILGAPKTRAIQTNTVTLAAGPSRSCAVDLIGTDHLRVVAVSAATSLSLGIQVFFFVVGVEPQTIKEGEAVTSNRDRDLGTKLDVAPYLAVNNQPDVRLIETDDAIRIVSTVLMIKNALLANKLTENQELLIRRSGCFQAPTNAQLRPTTLRKAPRLNRQTPGAHAPGFVVFTHAR